MIVSFDLDDTIFVDDEIHIKEYGNIFGFKVFLLKEENKAWVDEIWELICKLKKIQAATNKEK